jgi:hypothetical protein
MSLGMTLTTLQQTVNLIRGLRGMAAVAMFALGHGSGLLGRVAQFAIDLPIHGRDLFKRDLFKDLSKQRSGKGSFSTLPLT